MQNLFNRPKVYLFAFLAVVGGYLIVALARSFGGGVPAEFSEARLQGALIAQSIVDLSGGSIIDLQTINQLDKERNFTEALNLATAAINKSRGIRDEAIKLSSELEKMTKALSELKSFEARQAALESISNHLALITRLINYSGYLSQLLEVLRSRFAGDAINGEQVAVLVNQVNVEVTAINSFNNQAEQAMKRFDELVR